MSTKLYCPGRFVPSKAGRPNGGRSLAESAPILAPPDLGLDASTLALPLRRGAEVSRFNELSGRQERLTAAESDELYRYRLRRLALRERRLERAAAGEDEGELRGAIADYSRRLRELRSFELSRQQAGLAARYSVDPQREQRARERLVELAGRRPRGLIAGNGESVRSDAVVVRLSAASFTPGVEDAPLYLLAPTSIPSDALTRNVEAVAAGGAALHLVHDIAEVSRDRPALILNWGGSERMPDGLVVLNRPEAVHISSDQLKSLRALRELAPRTVVNPHDMGLLGSGQVVAKRRQGARGAGKRVLSTSAPATELAQYDVYQELLANRREYRVSVLSGRVVSAYLKRPPMGTSPEELRPDWSFERVNELPRSVAEVARQAVSRIGLDYAGVDVVEDLGTDRVLCLEANAAPGMSVETVRSLYAHVQQVLHQSQEAT
jgi:hypothetical protein